MGWGLRRRDGEGGGGLIGCDMILIMRLKRDAAPPLNTQEATTRWQQREAELQVSSLHRAHPCATHAPYFFPRRCILPPAQQAGHDLPLRPPPPQHPPSPLGANPSSRAPLRSRRRTSSS